jgi:sugar lactone lactonase YvrE
VSRFGRRVTRTELDGTITVLTDRYDGKRYNQPNDVTVDADGRIYFSDPRYGDRKGMEQKEDGKIVEGVYRIDLDGKVTRVHRSRSRTPPTACWYQRTANICMSRTITTTKSVPRESCIVSIYRRAL